MDHYFVLFVDIDSTDNVNAVQLFEYFIRSNFVWLTNGFDTR